MINFKIDGDMIDTLTVHGEIPEIVNDMSVLFKMCFENCRNHSRDTASEFLKTLLRAFAYTVVEVEDGMKCNNKDFQTEFNKWLKGE